MISQLRIYRVKDGLMDEWLQFFTGTIIRLHEQVGITVRAAWINPDDPHEFVWIREFDSLDSVSEQEHAFYNSPERLALGDVPGRYLDRRDVRVLEHVYRDTE